MLMLKNEEEIKSKLLLPYLEDLGFDCSEITLERTFNIRLGKGVNEISSNWKSGRLDLLCHKEGQNLFVIEVKRDTIDITSDDIEQGISYSRLLDNIAPFTIVSNGKKTRVFDTITKKELSGENISEQSPFWINGCTLAIDQDLKIRHYALKSFVSFSESNLKLFCELQVQSRMDTILGKSNEFSSKYIEELYIKRLDLHSTFNSFIQSTSSIFAIIGNAGVGKTNSICALALEYLENNFTLFYNAAILDKSPLYYISQDLNLFFSGKKDQAKIIKELNDFGEFVGRKIIVFIDAIDETGNKTFQYEISELALASKNFQNVKFCISCKLSIWDKFLFIGDNRTHLYEVLYNHEDELPFEAETTNKPGYILKEFNDKELEDLIPFYIKAFGLKGNISKALLEVLRNGFFLRVFCEVYKNKKIMSHF